MVHVDAYGMPYTHSQAEGRHPEGITEAPVPPLDPTEDPDSGRFGSPSPEFDGPPLKTNARPIH